MKYLLYIDPQECDSDDWGPPSAELGSLPEAMAAAGHPDPAAWSTDRHCPDEVFIDVPGDGYLSVLAPGAAAELAGMTEAAGVTEAAGAVRPSR